MAYLLGRVFIPEIIIRFFVNLFYHIQTFSNQFLLDELQQFVLLERLS